MRKGTFLAVILAFILGGVAGAFALLGKQVLGPTGFAVHPPKPVWTEVQWPFLMDQWGQGKAFRCATEACGTAVNLYLRAKIGFCNCSTGVSDDEELERLSDFDLMGTHIANLGDGRPITVGWMKGRSRSYAFTGAARGGKSALSIAFNDRCDAIVATIVTGHDQPGALEHGALEFLNGKTVLRWAEVTLGL
jgi:hypothetical protein